MSEPNAEVPLNGMVVRPGDTLIIHLDHGSHLTDAEREDYMRVLAERMPGVTVVFFEGIKAAGVYRPDPEPS